MDFAWLKDFGGFIKDLATVVLPVIGVIVGAKLAGRTADDQWLKKERLTAYVDLLSRNPRVSRRPGTHPLIMKQVGGRRFEGVRTRPEGNTLLVSAA